MSDTLNAPEADIAAVLTVPANVVTPATFTLSKFVCPSTSMSTKSPPPLKVVAVIIPVLPS